MTIMSNFASSFVDFEIPNWFDSQHLAGMLRGIEKEGLRVKPDGYLAQTPHPTKLGSKLTHPFITTDYSESLLELITDPKTSPKETLKTTCNYKYSKLCRRSIRTVLMQKLAIK